MQDDTCALMHAIINFDPNKQLANNFKSCQTSNTFFDKLFILFPSRVTF